MVSDAAAIPLIDLQPFDTAGADPEPVAEALDRACRRHGFFQVVGHGVDPALRARLDALARAFFAQDDAMKRAVAMDGGGRAWRGWFPVGGELTSGRPDHKEGLYFGAELPPHHPKVAAGVPLHGPNLFPAIDGFRETLLAYLDAMTALGHRLMEGLARGLRLAPDHFARRLTRDPLILFRIFHYPPLPIPARGEPQPWSVGEHTDYGLLTILGQDDAGGLEIRTRDGWVAVPPVPDAFVCNLGDMLERMTGGLYRSTPHRVRNQSGRSRLSFPFFFDPGWDARVEPVHPGRGHADDGAPRWDGASVHEFEGTYGDYLLAKVSKVFPELGREVL